MNSEGFVIGLQGYKGYERLHALQIFETRPIYYITQIRGKFLGCVFGLHGFK